MKEFGEITYHPTLEDLTQLLIKKTQSNNPLFFRVVSTYYFSILASLMRVHINTHDRGIIPVNTYALALSASGSGKGFSTNIIEESVIHKFRSIYVGDTFPIIAERHLLKLAQFRAAKTGLPEEEILDKLTSEYEQAGEIPFSFDSGTSPAIKQIRHKLLLSDIGSINLQMDEIGSNLVSNTDVLNTFLELYDIGKIKSKLIKNTADSKRVTEIEGRTPANMLLFGEPTKLLNGSKTEEEFYSMLQTGYARRCLFGYSNRVKKESKLSPEEVYDMLTDTSNDTILNNLANQLAKLADPIYHNTILEMDKQTALLSIEYRQKCEQLAEEFPEHADIAKAEMSHRYFKALKAAGAYAFIDNSPELTLDHMYQAIKLTEASGDAFNNILSRDRNYARLAKYIAEIKSEITDVDLVEDLPFYRGSVAVRRDLIQLATAYGYQHNILIKKRTVDGIDFFSGETLDLTDLDKLTISYSTDITEGYISEKAPWLKLYKLVTLDGYHYCAHHFRDGYRSGANVIEGFNLLIIDVDDGLSVNTAKLLLQDYTYLLVTTKRHTEEKNRFRVILPLSHRVKLNVKQYTKFMKNVFAWLPFATDAQTADIARKWQSFNGEYHYNEGQLVDAMLFIPDTKKEAEQSKVILDTKDLSNIERWLVSNMQEGNRSNMLIRYAFMLVDNGLSFEAIADTVHNFNDSMSNGLSREEVDRTVMVSVMRKITERGKNE